MVVMAAQACEHTYCHWTVHLNMIKGVIFLSYVYFSTIKIGGKDLKFRFDSVIFN